MSDDLSLYRPGLLSRAEAKATRRELTRMEARAKTLLGRIELEADLQSARVHGLAYVGKQAMQATALVSELEGQLGEMVPEARGRLKGIGDITALGFAEIVSDTVQRVSR
jgi:hypothetical protein